ncbi:hypothetical protein, partial [Lapillicoccus sp.]|uniref:hypothetical protein n=1 Tax=Lapillicoccus sp. TaxID=1909287 RepID=UPI003983132A
MTQIPRTTQHARSVSFAVLTAVLAVGVAVGPAHPDQRPPTDSVVTEAAAAPAAAAPAEAVAAPAIATGSAASVASRSVERTVRAFAAEHRFTVHLAPLPRYRGVPAYATTDMRTCQVWVTKATTSSVALDVLRHELIHVLACRAGTHFATSHFEHVADAGAALQGSRHAFYGRFSADDTLEA